jgi:hypothetical protein
LLRLSIKLRIKFAFTSLCAIRFAALGPRLDRP